jgi:hypothetical protein
LEAHARGQLLGSPLIEQRRRLLDQTGAIFQIPYLESTPR